VGRTQGGNNNAYCQDNVLTWHDWDTMDEDLLNYVRGLIRFRAEHPVFRQRRWFEGQSMRGDEAEDICWFKPNGSEMQEPDWDNGFAKSLQVYLNGGAIRSPNSEGERVTDSSFLLLFNAHHEAIEFRLPKKDWGVRWKLVLDTNSSDLFPEQKNLRPGSKVLVPERSLIVLAHVD